MDCKHPELEVQLSGEDGNAFFILGKVQGALNRAGHTEDAAAFMAEAMSGDYDHLLQTAFQYVSIV